MFLKSEYGISIADAEMTPDNLEMIERIARFVAQKQSAAAR
jgi:acyl carrier protein